MRNQIIKDIPLSKNQSIRCEPSKVEVADAHSSDYFKILQRFRKIRTVFIKDSMDNISDYLIPKYYDYMSNDCQMLEDRSLGGGHYGKKRYGSECRELWNETWPGHKLSKVAIQMDLANIAENEMDRNLILTFIHLIPQAVSFQNGDVFYGSLKISPQRCNRNLSKLCPKLPTTIQTYEEVFTISQFWGSEFYHGTLEDLPRIAPYLTFLQKHRHIRIHVAAEMKYLNLLGIDDSRLINGSVIKADILYMPPGGPCGNSRFFPTQILASTIANEKNHISSNKRDVIVLINRSKKRWFKNHKDILKMLKTHASNLNLKVEVFDDNPLPHIDKTVEMFHRALIVIAPHGAGEVNLIFSQPGTLLIEGLCYDSNNKSNLCYRNMAQSLGQQYYGLIYPHQCMEITANQIEIPFLEFLRNLFHYTPPS
ncbi:hypothetical protein LSH36_161g02013 [Paralvinella palmiformis]|uniref:Glycosyltransferase 61 catalytic domain-containing protein n=1 Tax=Paralvinella palmiformis TaxID=53620 RepID=A0AAD9N8H7_9ANNE|nr:hypothetical protein LSH36_161g02013 [Paralvinella palmiformis]